MSKLQPGAPSESAERLHPALEDVVGYRSGTLSVEGMERIEQHVVECSPCRERLAAAVAVLAQVDLIAERPLRPESLEVELLLERLAIVHENRWRRRPGALAEGRASEISSRPPRGAARVPAMGKSKRKSSPEPSGHPSGADGAFTLWGRGDLKSARAAAKRLMAEGTSEADRARLQRLLADTAPDPRALQIAVFCLAVVACVVLLTKLFG